MRKLFTRLTHTLSYNPSVFCQLSAPQTDPVNADRIYLPTHSTALVYSELQSHSTELIVQALEPPNSSERQHILVASVAVNSKPPPLFVYPGSSSNDVCRGLHSESVKRQAYVASSQGPGVLRCHRASLFDQGCQKKGGVECVVHPAQPQAPHMAMIGR
ncbi:hypothetical protein IAQ61_008109 [Plenodomus lingam]|uniref:uncharacterized protein n=1 Tax=Leptosphaeria maculans TaxID=5022 RepID=UPI00331653D8|nr:hypothetical protein IAQ61_008109 [Plenodomus lingam]